MTSASATPNAAPQKNSATRVLAASMIGTTIEFFDFYIYATAAVIVFPHLFFPAGDDTTALLSSLATFAIAFIARPVGAAFFGHYGDRIGRKATLVAALLLMGISTVVIGLLPTYDQVGVWAALFLALCRLGQGLGLGGEWGGAVLLATENAPEDKKAWYGMFPQLGAPVGFFLATMIFIVLDKVLGNEAFMDWGWRVPFLLSSVLVIVGLMIRLKITETPEFAKAIEKAERVEVPFFDVFKSHKMSLVLGTMAALATFVLFYIMTVFSLSYGTANLGYAREDFLLLQMVGVVFFGLFIPVSAVLADKFGMRKVMIGVAIGIAVFGLILAPMFGSGNVWGVLAFLCVGFALMGMTYGPLGTALAAPFPTSVRYTGASLTFNLGGIFGASFAPYIATHLANTYGLHTVGYYMIIAAVITLVAFGFIRQTAD